MKGNKNKKFVSEIFSLLECFDFTDKAIRNRYRNNQFIKNKKHFQIPKKFGSKPNATFYYILRIKKKFSLDVQKLSIALKYFQLAKNCLDRTDGTSNI